MMPISFGSNNRFFMRSRTLFTTSVASVIFIFEVPSSFSFASTTLLVSYHTAIPLSYLFPDLRFPS